jgi:Transposase DDE domain
LRRQGSPDRLGEAFAHRAIQANASARVTLGTPLLAIRRLSTYQRHSLWDIEMFFKWIKQHLRIKRFFGTSENAVKTQIWIAVSVYVLVAIVKKRLNLDASLYTLLQVLSVTLFEKIPIDQALAPDDSTCDTSQITNQLNLFAY